MTNLCFHEKAAQKEINNSNTNDEDVMSDWFEELVEELTNVAPPSHNFGFPDPPYFGIIHSTKENKKNVCDVCDVCDVCVAVCFDK